MENSIKTRLAESKRITGLAKLTICIAVILSLAFTANVSAGPTLVTTLTGDTVPGGSALDSGGTLVTWAGDITFSGEFKNPSTDPDMTDVALGARAASENTFNILPSNQSATLFFDFDVYSLGNFVYGGNYGNIDIKAFDEYGNEVDSFHQPDTDDGQPAGPITLDRGTSAGIRSLQWTDDNVYFTGYAALDNIDVNVDVIPSPSALVLAGIGVGLVSRLRKRRIV